MDLLTFVIFPLIGFKIILTEGSMCNSTIPHGKVNCEDTWNRQKCRYSCDNGYQTSVSSLLSCDSQTGMWTLYSSLLSVDNFFILDEDVLCLPEDGRQCTWNLPNADLDLSCDNRPGNTCTYQCRTPYHSIYSPPKITCQETNLMWSHERLCSVVRCAGSFRGGRMSAFCDMYEGSTCTVQCDYGYIAMNDSLHVTCLSTGRWNHNLLKFCQQRLRCPPVFNNGYIDNSCDMHSGSLCIYKCNKGFTKYVDQMLVTCLANGTWSSDLTGICVKDTQCSSYVPNGWISSTCSRVVGNTCSINCHSGVPSGMTATCLYTGQWDVDLSNICMYKSRDSYSIGDNSVSSRNIFIPLMVVVASVITVFVCVIVIYLRKGRCQNRCNIRRSPRHETRSISHISTMYTVGQCRLGSNLNGSVQSGSQAHDVSPPPYTEVMKDTITYPDLPPSYEEVHASPSSFHPDSYA